MGGSLFAHLPVAFAPLGVACGYVPHALEPGSLRLPTVKLLRILPDRP